MIDPKTLRTTVDRIVATARQPTRVIVFGSQARGDARDESDLDLLVVEKEVADPGEETARLQEALAFLPMPADILVYSEAEFRERSNWCSSPVYWAVREGTVVYERPGG